MSLWRRAPRQVYCVYGEEEYLSEEHAAGETELPRQMTGTGSFEQDPEITGEMRSRAGSHTSRLIWVGLLLGVMFGTGALFVSYLTREISPSRGGASSRPAPHRLPPASSGPLPRGMSGATVADTDAQRRSSQVSASRTSSSGHPGSASAATRSDAGSAGTPFSRSGRTIAARKVGATPSVAVLASTATEAPAASAAAGDEFEFER